MSQSLSKIYIHSVFGTKGREPVLNPEIQKELHAYLAGILRHIDCQPIQTGGTDDHVHVLYLLSRTRTIAEVAEIIKKSSSKWIKTKDDVSPQFQWQTGYGAFSVSKSESNKVSAYILNQNQHHKKLTFQDEYRLLLKKHEVKYEEKYIWD